MQFDQQPIQRSLLVLNSDPHCNVPIFFSGQLFDDARPQQRQETDDRQDR